MFVQPFEILYSQPIAALSDSIEEILQQKTKKVKFDKGHRLVLEIITGKRDSWSDASIFFVNCHVRKHPWVDQNIMNSESQTTERLIIPVAQMIPKVFHI